MLVTGCAGSTSIGDPSTTIGPVTTIASVTTEDPGFETATIEISGTRLTVWVADTPALRAQGLRDVEALPQDVDGMLFAWGTPANPVFVMRDTLIPLDIWWFGPQGDLLGVTEMRTCPDGDCILYNSPGVVAWALETPAGTYDFPPEAHLSTSVSG